MSASGFSAGFVRIAVIQPVNLLQWPRMSAFPAAAQRRDRHANGSYGPKVPIADFGSDGSLVQAPLEDEDAFGDLAVLAIWAAEFCDPTVARWIIAFAEPLILKIPPADEWALGWVMNVGYADTMKLVSRAPRQIVEWICLKGNSIRSFPPTDPAALEP